MNTIEYVCLFAVYLTTIFQYLRLHSVNFYSSLIRLPSSSEAGETRVRNMAAEFCRRVPIVLVGFFNMLNIYDMGPTALLPLRRKACCGFLSPLNIHRPQSLAGFEPVILGSSGNHATTRPPRANFISSSSMSYIII
jgi:hypothetical protein